jgi:hypothetical protein
VTDRAFRSAQRAYDGQEHPDYYSERRRRPARTMTLPSGEEVSEVDLEPAPKWRTCDQCAEEFEPMDEERICPECEEGAS